MPQFKGAARLLERRGPDSQSVHTARLSDGSIASFYSTVLHVRGEHNVPQPLVSDRFVLQWNGEIFDGLDVSKGCNDTERLFEELHKPNVSAVQVLNVIQGPFAAVVFDIAQEEIWFARDRLGRRSLLTSPDLDSLDTLMLSSIGGRGREWDGWLELSPKFIYRWSKRHGRQTLSWNDVSFGRINASLPPALDSTLLELPVDETTTTLRKSIRQRVLNISSASENAVAILFSGGVDSMVMAALADQELPAEMTIDLVNVAFENTRFASRSPRQQEYDYESVPDRITGRQGMAELRRHWRFIMANVSLEEYHANSDHVKELMWPHTTAMDLSIAIAIWFAARGKGCVDGGVDCTSPAKVVLIGIGADEQLAGYSRHRGSFEKAGYAGLLRELQMDFDRLPFRNLGRDDRIVGDHGREARFPFLDEKVVCFFSELPIQQKCDMALGRGIGEKRLLRLVAERLGMPLAARLPKRAIQFGAKTAKMLDSHEHGRDLV